MIEDLNITKVERAHTGSWVVGTVDGYKFQALVFAEHAVLPVYELAGSKTPSCGYSMMAAWLSTGIAVQTFPHRRLKHKPSLTSCVPD